MLTGQADEQLLQNAINDAGVHRVFYKPIDPESFSGFLEEIIAQSELQQTPQANEAFGIKTWHLAGEQEIVEDESQEQHLQPLGIIQAS